MAKPTNDASDSSDDSKTESVADKFANLKTQFEAEETGRQVSATEDDEDDDAAGDAEADDANNVDDDANTDDGDDDSQDDSADGNDSGDDKVKQVSGFRLSQFKGEDGTADSYIKNLENGYLESSQEGIKQRERADSYERQVNAVKAAAGKDPEFGKKLLGFLKDGGGSADNTQGGDDFADSATQTSDNPFLVHAETEWNTKNDASVKEFVDANPEVLTDPKINADVKRWAKVYTREVYDTEKRLLTTGEAMTMAFKQLGLEDKRNKQQDLVSGMKKNAAPIRPQATKKKPSSNSGNAKQFSDATLTFAQKMGISKERLAKGSKR